ncbi:MAG: AgmX/PglI C-terminal domain-containing protein [Candidatus Devosia euplotis]|nr:AgmX/PglI C-terminal domain-containing protein [Candidatus Devosia euplotis]
MKRLALALLLVSSTASAAPEAKKMSPEQAQEKVRQTLNASGGAVDACTARYVAENPAKPGMADVKVEIAEDGSVSKGTVNTTLPGARNLRSCLERVAKSWRFPKPGGPGQKFTLNIPVKANVKFRMLSEAEKKAMTPKEKKERGGFMTFMPNFTFRGPTQ